MLPLNQASSKDINAYFQGFGVAWIEWLNGVSLNVLFDDKFTAARALQQLSLPIPEVEGVCIIVVIPICRCWCRAERNASG